MTWQNFTDSELSTYLQELAAGSSPTCCSGTDRSALSKSSSIPAASSPGDRKKGTCLDSRSGTMCEPSTELRGEELPTSSVAGSPARTSPRRVKVPDLPEPVRDFGSRCSALLEKFGLALSSPKTVRTCVPVASAPSSKDLPRWGMTCDGVCWEHGTSVRITNETECGYWPTPTAMRSTGAGRGPAKQGGDNLQTRVAMWPTPTQTDSGGRGYQKSGTNLFFCLPGAVGAAAIPAELESRRLTMYPTASARDWKDTPGMTAQRKDGKGRNDQLARRIYSEEQTPSDGGNLNPTWVEWLMGWPIGWTESKPLETDKFRSWRQLHGISSPTVLIRLDIDLEELRKIVVQVLNHM